MPHLFFCDVDNLYDNHYRNYITINLFFTRFSFENTSLLTSYTQDTVSQPF